MLQWTQITSILREKFGHEFTGINEGERYSGKTNINLQGLFAPHRSIADLKTGCV